MKKITEKNAVDVEESFFVQKAIWFLTEAKRNPRIGPAHISLYISLLYCYQEQRINPVYIFSVQIMPLAKIAGSATYHRAIRDLHAMGCIKYVPSYYHLLGSLVYL